jgi:hypothetical protein
MAPAGGSAAGLARLRLPDPPSISGYRFRSRCVDDGCGEPALAHSAGSLDRRFVRLCASVLDAAFYLHRSSGEPMPRDHCTIGRAELNHVPRSLCAAMFVAVWQGLDSYRPETNELKHGEGPHCRARALFNAVT